MEKNSKKGKLEPETFQEKVIRGLKLAHKRMIKSKIEKNQSLVLFHNGKIITIKASDFSKLN
ncbi:hypothetical protein [Flavobacterium sp.]|jgi:hypothetical protein|uniref:hypothetical protein n=1 Tax=Flavobacterium sp. TaxID=239 RepID=UPI0037C0CFA6